MKARKFRRLLERELGYRLVPGRGKGSHRFYAADGRPDVLFAYHDNATIGGDMVRRILTVTIGLSIEEAKEVASRG